jgi:hypothetical protein
MLPRSHSISQRPDHEAQVSAGGKFREFRRLGDASRKRFFDDDVLSRLERLLHQGNVTFEVGRHHHRVGIDGGQGLRKRRKPALICELRVGLELTAEVCVAIDAADELDAVKTRIDTPVPDLSRTAETDLNELQIHATPQDRSSWHNRRLERNRPASTPAVLILAIFGASAPQSLWCHVGKCYNFRDET